LVLHDSGLHSPDPDDTEVPDEAVETDKAVFDRLTKDDGENASTPPWKRRRIAVVANDEILIFLY
jgi:hypothetical protein